MAWLLKGIASFTAFVACLSPLRDARAQAAPASPDWLESQVNESGQHCARLAEQRQADRMLLACGAAGVWEFTLGAATPRFVRSYAFAGDAVGFVSESDGRLWVKLQVLEARPFPGASAQGAAVFPDVASPGQPPAVSAPPPAPAPAPPVPARPQSGHVVRASPGEALISLGGLDGIARGDHIEIAIENAGDDGSEEAQLSREVAAVGVVTNVGAKSARVGLGLNESVPAGALATPTRASRSSSLTAPPRVSGLWEMELFLRPFVALEELGGGAVFSGSFGYRFTHFHLQAVLDPLAFAAAEGKGNVTAVNAAVIGSYDSQYFELGLGFGAQTVNETGFLVEPGSGLSVAQLVRLGARDGLNLSARTSLALFHSQFQFGGLVVSGQIPVTRGYWLLLNGGGGNVGYGYGEFGLRVLLSGNGLSGSTFLSVTAGGVGIFRSSCEFNCEGNVSYGGPMAGVGGEWRF